LPRRTGSVLEHVVYLLTVEQLAVTAQISDIVLRYIAGVGDLPA
jgi:hypothetical protein